MNDINEIKCPHCGNHDLDRLTYRRPVLEVRELVRKNGKIMVSGELHDLLAEGPGGEMTEEDLFCEKCRKTFPCPKSIEMA